MTEEDIFNLADNYADWDDFGRWVFRNSDKLLEFVDAVEKKVHETSMKEPA